MNKKLMALILLIIIILSLLYVYKGENWLSEIRSRKQQENKEYLLNELIENLLDIQNRSEEIISEFLKTHYELDFFPDPELQIVVNWETQLPFPITSKPIFDHKNIYLFGGKKIIVLDKKTHDILWSRTLPSSISAIELTDANRILIFLKSDKLININRNNG